jgi:hypothetical protein
VIDKFAVTAAAHAGAHDGHLGIERAIRARRNLRDHAVCDVGANIAFTAAVKGAAGLDNTLSGACGLCRRSGFRFGGKDLPDITKGSVTRAELALSSPRRVISGKSASLYLCVLTCCSLSKKEVHSSITQGGN